MKKSIYAGSFDPFHYGHKRIVERAARMFDEVVVAVVDNPAKKCLFTPEQRSEMVTKDLAHLKNVLVTICPPHTLLCDYALQLGATTIIKGIRNLQDTEYEKMLHEITVSQEVGIDTCVLFAAPQDQKISSGAVKELVKYNADVKDYVSLYTKQLLELKLNNQRIVGLTGMIGSGKSYIAKLLTKAFGYGFGGRTLIHIDVDKIVRDLTYGPNPNNAAVEELREQFSDMIGLPLYADGKANTKPIADALFKDKATNLSVARLYLPHVVREIRRQMAGKEGDIIIDWALLIDFDLTHLCNNNVLVVRCSVEEIKARLLARYRNDYTAAMLRYDAQMPQASKIANLSHTVIADKYGQIVCIDNDKTSLASFTLSEAQKIDEATKHLEILFKRSAPE